jgi:hypothetical protein
MVARPQAGSGVRIAELVATLSYAADLGLGQPMVHCMRQTVIALRLGELAGASDSELEATYYLGLMMNVYCHADAAEQAPSSRSADGRAPGAQAPCIACMF